MVHKSPRSHKKGTKAESLGERLSRSLDIPPDVLPGSSLITIHGRSALTLSGSSSIILYTPEEIRLSTKRGALSVKGKALVCISYNAAEITVEGRINSVSFEEEYDIG